MMSTNQNLVSNYGLDVSNFDKFRDNIICSKINIRVPLPPVYVREVWDDSHANVENIKALVIWLSSTSLDK